MRGLQTFCLMLGLSFAGGALAQEAEGPLPDRRVAIYDNVDFYGSDLRSIFETSYEACETACLIDENCRAFTYNRSSRACFPKSDIADRVPFNGAVSAEVIETPQAAKDLAAERQAELSFLRAGDFEAAREEVKRLPRRHVLGDTTADQYAQQASLARGQGRWSTAVAYTGAAIVLSDDATLWVDYAEDMMNDRWTSNTRTKIRSAALPAAINGYLRSSDAVRRAAASRVIAIALENNGRGRDSIPALQLAVELSPRRDLQDALDRAIAQFGFRIVEHLVEADGASPRICAEFSEEVVAAGVDYEPFVRLLRDDGMPETGYVVEPQGSRLCLDGVTHGQRYEVQFREGLPAASGQITSKPYVIEVYVRDREPQVRFPGRAYVLPKVGEAAVPVTTVNASSLDLVLSRVSDRNILRAIQEDFFGRPLSKWQEDRFSGDISEEVWRGTGAVEGALNADVTTRLPMGEVIADLSPGIYALNARVTGEDVYETAAATQWFVISDLGIATMSGIDGMHVFVRSLGSAEPKVGVEVTLVSRANAVLGTIQTDAQGYAVFPAGLSRGTGGAAPALVTVEEDETDIAFLSLTEPEFDLSDRGVEGREAAPPIDIFMTTERGVYRAGDTIHVTALARDGKVDAIEGLPLTAILSRPDGVEYSRHLSENAQAGGHVFDLPVAGSAPRGSWTIALHADPDATPLATQTVLVEDFLPERIDFTLTLPDGPIYVTDTPRMQVEARYLFGAPAADMPVAGSVQVRAVRSLPDFPGYQFGRYDQPFEARTNRFAGETRTDSEGRTSVAIDLPNVENADRPLEARFTVSVTEGSGRPVERQLTKALASTTDLIGIKPAFDGVVPEGSEARFDLIAVNPEGARTEMPVRWTLNRVERRYQWYQQNGRWRWEPVTNRTRVAVGDAELTADGALSVAAPVDWGTYELRVERTGGTYAASSVEFYAGWYAPADASQTPDTLELSLDKPAYNPGDTATVRIVPRYAGKAVVTVVSNRLIAMQAVDVTEGENTLTFPVTDEWGSGAYVTASVIRPMDVAASRNPARALGLAHAAVDPGARRLETTLDMPAEVAPRGPMEVALRVQGVAEGETAWATIAAVDLGILNLTSFQSPDPEDHYFGQRKLGMGIRDVYGRLIDGMNGALGEVRSGGDAITQKSLDGNPPTEELVAYFSGPVEVGADGIARATFDMPSFNGTVRVMAVAWSKSGVGQAETDVLVRDPVVVTATVPRFMAPGDESRLLLEIVHATGPSGRMGLDVSADGLVLMETAPSGVDLEDLGSTVISVPMRATDVGLQTLRVALTTPDGRQLVKELTVPVEVNDPEIARQSRFTLAGGETFTFDSDVFAGLYDGTGTAALSAGPLARFDAPGLLTALDRYPYGCTEQITSTALPLLYFDEVAEAMGVAARDKVRERVDQAIAEVLTNQSSNGAFGLWRPSSGDLWLDAYVTDFLSRAKAQGFDVPDIAFRMAMDNLRNQVNYYPDFDSGGRDLAYALMVLAREGAAAVGDLRYYADVKGNAFNGPLAAAQLGSALAYYGDPSRADRMFARAVRLIPADRYTNARLWRADYGTPIRDVAGVLALAVEAGSNAVDRQRLSERLSRDQSRRSTQEAVWSLLAAHALIDAPGIPLSVDGVPEDGPFVRVLEAQTDTAPIEIRNEGDREETFVLTTFGVPSEPEPAGGNGWNITRRYYTMEGAQVELGDVTVGTRLVTLLEVTPLGRREARLMVDDPLPAGFEIDNPNLLREGDIRALDWLNVRPNTQNTEFRQERFLAAVDHYGDDPFRLAYIVRAISPGRYHHPAASVEDMYRPDFRARTAAGEVVIVE